MTDPQAEEFYALRYHRDVPLKHRAHAPTIPRYPDWSSAEDARVVAAHPDRLEVVRRVVPFKVVQEAIA